MKNNIYLIQKIMDIVKGHEIANENKKDIVYVRLTESMLNSLRKIRKSTGIPMSEVIRESIKRTLVEVETTGSMSFKIE